jgi:hypothetical protein
MSEVSKAELRGLLRGLSPAVRQAALALRDAVRRAVPQAAETVLWGGLSYHRPEAGGRVKGAVCQIGVKRGKVRLDFIHGVRLADPARLLQGDRLSKRFIVIEGTADAERPEIAALIREAAALDWSGLEEPGP